MNVFATCFAPATAAFPFHHHFPINTRIQGVAAADVDAQAIERLRMDNLSVLCRSKDALSSSLGITEHHNSFYCRFNTHFGRKVEEEHFLFELDELLMLQFTQTCCWLAAEETIPQELIPSTPPLLTNRVSK